MPSWRADYLAALEARDKREKATLDIFNAYTKLADRTASLSAEPTPASISASAEKLPTGTSNAPPDTQLRTELLAAQRSKTELHARLKITTEELEKLRRSGRAGSQRVAELAADKAGLERRVRDRDEELKGKGRLLEDVQDEMISLNLQLNMAEEKTAKLQRENKELVDRWMVRMGREAEAMNDASRFS